MCACPVRTGGGAPTNEPASTPYRRSTRLGCECVLDRFAPGAVLLQTHLPPPRVVGAPVPGANVCLPRSHWGRCSYDKPATASCRRSTRLGCECVPAPFAPGAVLLQQACLASCRRSTRLGCEYVLDRFAPGAVLLQTHLPPPRIVGAPVPGANVCRTGSHRGRCSYKHTCHHPVS